MTFNDQGEHSYHAGFPQDDAPPSPRGSKKWIGAAAAVVLVVALSVGGVAIAKVMGGGGAQPEDVLPNSAIAFAKLDLNPSAGQKLAAFRLASRFPTVRGNVTSQDTSIKESLFGSIFTGNASWGLDYKRDVQPWLGDRIGVGVFPGMGGDKKPEMALAIAFTDRSAAQTALDKAIAHAGNKVETVGYSFADEYVIVSDTAAHATALVAAGRVSPLALPAWSTYGDDVRSLGSDQIGVAWVDVAASYKLLPQDQLTNSPLGQLKGKDDPKNASGRLVIGLHADPSYLELTGKAIDLKGAASLTSGGVVNQAGLMATFPSDVFGAATATGVGKAAGDLYTGLVSGSDSMGVRSMLSAIGINSAKEVETLLGSETGVAVGGTIDQPEYAVRTRSDDPDTAYGLARKVLDTAKSDIQGITLTKVTGPDGIVVGKGSGLIAAITSGSGSKLGSSDSFRQVVPDRGRASFAAYVNLAELMPLLARDNPKDAASLKPLNAVGLTATAGVEPTVRLRLSFR